MSDPVTLGTILAGAAGVGVLHTLLGPDHYLPWIALARDRGWNGRRALLATAGAGLVHCLTSAVLVPVAILLTEGAATLAGVQGLRSDLTAWLLVGLGVALGLAAWRRRRNGATCGRAASWWLLVAFALGPCEWLIPGALAAHAGHGAVGTLAAIGAFTAATVATMLATVGVGLHILPTGWRMAGMLPAAACVLSGTLILVGL